MPLREINLIPEEILERREFFRRLRLWSAGLILAAVLVAAAHEASSRAVRGGTQTPHGTAKERVGALTQVVAEIRKEQQELNLARRQQQLWISLTDQRRPYAPVLARLSDLMNDRTWLRQLSLNTAADHKLVLSLTGFAQTHDALGSFLQRLSGDSLFSRVQLKSAHESQEKTEGPPRIQFQIECEIAKEAS